MRHKSRNHTCALGIFSLLILASLSCLITASPTQAVPAAVTQIIPITKIVPVTQIVTATNTPLPVIVPLEPEIILQRLTVSFLGQDGKKVIGSGCPGTDGKGTIVDYHFVVSGVDENREVQKVLVAGDNSTLTWAFPCSNSWALVVKNLGNGIWEIFIAPSLPSQIYTVLFFYSDATAALGMVNAK